MYTKLLESNKNIRKITGVQNFHDAGYYGKRVIAASGEYWDINFYNPDGLVSDPMNYSSSSDHGLKTAACFFQVAPLAHLVMFTPSGRFGGDGTYSSDIISKAFPYIKENNITAMFSSLSTEGNDNYRKDYNKNMEELPYFCSCWSAGNNGAGKYGKMLELENVIGVGGFDLINNSPDVSGASGSSNNDYLVDFCAPFTVHCHTTGNSDIIFSGTSAAAPWLCGMICLINDFFIDKTGKPLSREKMNQFLIDYCKDIDEDGTDKRSGYGIPVLPKPEDIDIWKYAEKDKEPNIPPDNSDSWAKEAWEKAYNKVDIDGVTIIDGTRPKDNITRQEMVTILNRLGLLD